jgi:hypothetical protein
LGRVGDAVAAGQVDRACDEEAKEHEAPDTLYGRWRTEAAERGHDPDSLVRAVNGRTANRSKDQAVSDGVAGRLFDQLAGPEGLTACASTFA